jgi:hypothetical protein
VQFDPGILGIIDQAQPTGQASDFLFPLAISSLTILLAGIFHRTFSASRQSLKAASQFSFCPVSFNTSRASGWEPTCRALMKEKYIEK